MKTVKTFGLVVNISCTEVSLRAPKLQYSSQIVETGAICPEFSVKFNFLHSLFTPLFSLECPPLLPQCWATRILEHWNDCKPKSTLGRGKSRKCFKIYDEDCRIVKSWLRIHSFSKNICLSLEREQTKQAWNRTISQEFSHSNSFMSLLFWSEANTLLIF